MHILSLLILTNGTLDNRRMTFRYEFNDSSVSEIKEEEIQKTFGEEDDKYNRSGMSYYYSSSNAYMLMYRRIDPTKNVKPFGDNVNSSLLQMT